MAVTKLLAEAVVLFEEGLAASSRPEDRRLVNDYLARLAPMLADLVLGREIGDRITDLEHLFGNSWVVDAAPFEAAFAKYREFKSGYST